MAIHWHSINPTTWTLQYAPYTAVIVHDPSTGVFRPCIRRLAGYQYETVLDLPKAFALTTAMRRCKKWLRKAGLQ
jgi:hypothetical protein